MRYIEPMLAPRKAADPQRLVPLCEDERYGASQKIDGDRLLIHVEDGVVIPVSRNHSTVAGVPKTLLDQFKTMTGRWVFDGEFFEKRFYVFDLIEGAGRSFMHERFIERYAVLEHFFAAWNPAESIRLLPLAVTHEAKCELAEWVLANGCEGLMFKRLDSSYEPGARSEKWVKIKFRNDVECEVKALGTDGKANMVLQVYKDGVPVVVGECTAVAGDGPRVNVGDVVTVLYQYASKTGKLIQPTMPKLRPDKHPEDCTWDQLVFQGDKVRIDV